VTALFPFLNNDDTDRSILKLTKVQLAAALGMSVVSWLSINYQLKVTRDLQLVDAVQVQNALLFSLQYTRASLNPVAAAAKADKERLAAEEKARIAELEARVTIAEQRAAAAEAQLKTAPAIEPAPLPEPPATDTSAPMPPPAGPR
jgi:peptidoglycan hydrolase CwlO-like protein